MYFWNESREPGPSRLQSLPELAWQSQSPLSSLGPRRGPCPRRVLKDTRFERAYVINLAKVRTNDMGLSARSLHCPKRPLPAARSEIFVASTNKNDFAFRRTQTRTNVRPMLCPAPVIIAGRPQGGSKAERHPQAHMKLATDYLVRPVVVSRGCNSFTRRSSNGYVV